jgi:hypothetical protein
LAVGKVVLSQDEKRVNQSLKPFVTMWPCTYREGQQSMSAMLDPLYQLLSHAEDTAQAPSARAQH